MRGLLTGFTDLVHDRLALLGNELRAEVLRARWMVVSSISAVLLGALGLAFAGLALVISVGEQYRALVAAAVAILFGAGAAYAAWRAKCALSARAGAFSGSLGELERDREALLARSESERKSVADTGRQVLSMVSIGLMAYDIARRLRR
ncbi:MAG TPA: phage holin family protein [Burkholderiales bacterium]|nr:phage holin family protein [Burkholderiales bacterium]